MSAHFNRIIFATTLRGERIMINFDNVFSVAETKKGTIVRFADGDFVECSETFEKIVRKIEFAVVRSANDIKQK